MLSKISRSLYKSTAAQKVSKTHIWPVTSLYSAWYKELDSSVATWRKPKLMTKGKYWVFLMSQFYLILSSISLYSVQAKEQFLQFSKAPIMSNFGALPFGSIPEPLRHVRPFRKFAF